MGVQPGQCSNGATTVIDSLLNFVACLGEDVIPFPVMNDRLGYLRDRLDIYDCLVRYARGLDRHDAELIASAFWPDAQANYGALFSGPRDDFVV
jgi:hypothetical protein